MWDKQLDSLEVSYATLMTAKEEGFEEGFEKGREEGREATYLQLVRRLVQKGMTDNEIVELTDLPLSTIMELRQQSMV
ncbi:TPA: hypothetical protein ACGORW_000145 [Streptococcus suis]|nr:hypothetical protein [Streptococcus suis]MBY5040002.1 hypothetical protein [Streptococcus suis]HEM5998486.1 hypothetical protein [Streptococcus suis]HEM6373056.1 hypothetical protein [Streptococcus suis]